MLRVGPYVFKRAETQQEFDQIHCLNHRTFVAEIPQHPDSGDGKLIDKFHGKNAYFIVLRDERVVGMVSVHDQPPFSVADRLPDPAVLQRAGTRPMEVRLLAIEPCERNSTLFFGLLWVLYGHTLEEGCTHLFISGVVDRLDLYERLGFEPLGPAVASGNAMFVPMVLNVGQLPKKVLRVKRLWESHLEKTVRTKHPVVDRRTSVDALFDHAPPSKAAEICLLPGPVTIAAAVRSAFQEAPIYHRGPEFIRRFLKVRRQLGDMVGGRYVAILNGSGTLANEAVAATLAATPGAGRGILLINGEFGQRLARQAIRFGLHPRTLVWDWGQPWNLREVETALAEEPVGTWIWGVHQESSTGVLNDLPGLVQLAKKHGARICVDCISSLGAVPLDLRDVYLATGATGKSVGAYAGAAIIFAGETAMSRVDRSRVPSYFDIVAAFTSDGPCYTFPSPTVRALETALEEYATEERAQAAYTRYADLGAHVREQLRHLGLEPLAADDHASPVITTFTPPRDETSLSFVERCRTWGFAIGGESSYLAERRLVQIATMGAVTLNIVNPLFAHIERWLNKSRQPALAM
jgi:aspartate aminotransferase-like enzyme